MNYHYDEYDDFDLTLESNAITRIVEKLACLEPGKCYTAVELLIDRDLDNELEPDDELFEALDRLVAMNRVPFEHGRRLHSPLSRYRYVPRTGSGTAHGSEVEHPLLRMVGGNHPGLVSFLQYKMLGQVCRRISRLTPGEKYTAAEILGDEPWHDQVASPSSVGKDFASLVERGCFPFRACGSNHKHVKLYLFTPE